MNIAHASASARSEEHIDDVDASQLPQQDVLIQPWSSTNNRLSSKPADATLSAVPQRPPPSSFPTSAIHPSRNTFTSNSGQDVHYTLSVDSGPQYPSSPAFPRNGQHTTLEGPVLSSPASNFYNGSINSTNSRLRTNLPVFGTTSTLAAHYGIPTRLPPIPRVNANNSNNTNRLPIPRLHESAPSTSTEINYQYHQSVPDDNSPVPDTHILMADYLKMMNEKPAENGPASAVPYSPARAPAQLEPARQEAAKSFSSMLFGGEIDFTSPMWDEYLTSPMLDETPFEPYLQTPAAPNVDDFFQSPVVADHSIPDPTFDDMPLVAQPSSTDYSDAAFTKDVETVTSVPPPSGTDSGTVSPIKAPVPNFDGMYTLSPSTPALEPPSTPFIDDMSADSSNAKSTGRKKIPTGTRKNITPDSLIPIDAPTQPRNYVAPSTTSRKPVPAVFARKRARSAALGMDEEDELAGSEGGGDVPLNPNEEAAIEAKRRQNTLAARRSRKRKLEYQRELEDGLEATRRERDLWKERAMMLRTRLIQLGQQDPFMNTPV